MFNSRTNETLPFSQLPQYLYTSSIIGTKHELTAIPERAETPKLFTTTENMNHYYNDSLVNNDNASFTSRIVQPAEGKKDKHSKVVTARGPRDRRMRLSIEVSKKFFGLHDMLGFDRASKTLEWLFTQSKSEIEELTQKQNQVTSVKNEDLVGQAEKSARKLRRAEARARARERTRNKQCLSLIRSECNSSTTKEVDRRFCNNEESGHMSSVIISPKGTSNGDLLLPCPTTENTWGASWQP